VVEHAAPTKVIVSFDLLPGWQEAWSDLWTRIGRLALTRPACSEFRLLRDWRDGKRCFVVSTWTDAQAFDQFAREVGLAWMAREMRQVASPTGITYQISQRSNADSDLDSLPLDEAPLDE
jgi:quinol monooxygenase YgiN